VLLALVAAAAYLLVVRLVDPAGLKALARG
jgi:hypothetical protein